MPQTKRSAASSWPSPVIRRSSSWTRSLGVLDTSFAEGGVAHTAARSIAATVRRDHHDELAARLDGWIDDLRGRAERGEFLFSVNDYSALLRNPPR